jgi:predicted acetyltransferase
MRVLMAPDVRTPTEDDRQAMIDVMRSSLNFPEAWATRRGPLLPIQDFRCAYENGVLKATAAAHRFRQWFGGRSMEMSGVFGVATVPEHRASGLASAAVEQVLREARDTGMPVSALFPAVLRPYRKLGYELAGTYTTHRLPLEAIPAGLGTELPAVTEMDVDRDLEGIKACFHRWVEGQTGTFEPQRDEWWTKRILSPAIEEQSRFVVVRGSGGEIEGYAAFRYTPVEGRLDVDFGLSCAGFTATTDAALRALLSYFRGFRGVGVWVEWTGPPADPISLLIPEQKVETPFRFAWMLRLLDVQAGFAQRGYPPVDAEAIIAVADPLFPENAGPWRITVKDGTAEVAPEPAASPRRIPIGALSALFTGYLRLPDSVRLGYLDADDPAVDGLSRMLQGPDPWFPFFF